jgi:uncharacterized protein YjbI with pentapeptide repeats
MNAAGRDIRGCEFVGQDLTGAIFDGCNLYGVRIHQCGLRRASFRGAVFAGAEVTDLWSFGGKTLEGADFTNATINGAHHFSQPLSGLKLSPEQLMSTWSYRNKDLHQCAIYGSNDWGQPVALDLRRADLRQATFRGDLSKCDFANARIYGGITLENFTLAFAQLASTLNYKQRSLRVRILSGGACAAGLTGKWDFSGINLEGSYFWVLEADANFVDAKISSCTLNRNFTKAQLYSTKSYKDGYLGDVEFLSIDLSGCDLSGMNLTGCRFSHCRFAGTKFDDAVITGARFITDRSLAKSDRLTVEQITSTWNYKHGRMEGIRLPDDLAEALPER